jgi:hypothetical protein
VLIRKVYNKTKRENRIRGNNSSRTTPIMIITLLEAQGDHTNTGGEGTMEWLNQHNKKKQRLGF